ncbi:DUF3331 domain-containing protein [Paraburkholderia silviterrae]|nr:DUF3331 domain-containing protein [Paraburkholderia silviterrae]
MKNADPAGRTWCHTMTLLGLDSVVKTPRTRPFPCPARTEYGADAYPRCAVKVIERQGPSGATVAWSDPTACCYGEQLWRRCVARKSGICALSGQAIARGEAVYRPRFVQPAPRNFEAMILASVMEAIPLAEPV